MKNLRYIKLLIFASALWARALFAIDTTLAQHVEQRVTTEITSIMKGFDPDAMVFVRVGVATVKDVELPGTPFNVETTTLAGSDGQAKLDSINVRILTNNGKVPDEVKAIIESLATVNDVKPKIDYQARPKGYLSPEERLRNQEKTADRGKDGATGSMTSKEIVDQNTLVGREVRDAIKNSLNLLGGELRPVLLAGAIGVGLAVVVLLIVVFTLIRQSSKIASVMAEKAQGSSGAAPEMVQASKSRKSDDQRGPTGSSQMGGGEAMEVLRSLPPEAIMEILGDCYWGSLDGYALYIWNRISVEHKRKILESSKLLSAYVVALGNVPERDLAAHGDPAYLKDLKLAHLSNDAIAELVRKKSVPLAVLPKLRVESLPLTVAEWLDLNSDKTPATDARPDFAAIPASQGRALRVLRQFTKVTPDDEEAITGMKGVDVEVIQSVRSLAWIVSIEGEPLTELLKGFTAQELAEALDAPKSAIEHTLKHLPDKKRQLTMDYMKQGIASKQSDAFNDLFTAVLQAMRQNATAESASNDDETQEQEQDNVNAA